MLLHTLPVLPTLIRKLGLNFHLIHLEALMFQLRADLIHLLVDEGGRFFLFRPDYRTDFALAVCGQRDGNGPEFDRVELDLKALRSVFGRAEYGLFNLVQRLGRERGGQVAGFTALCGKFCPRRQGGKGRT